MLAQWFGHTRFVWNQRLAAKSTCAETREPGDPAAH